ncbi:MAG: methyltransferase [Planctomycetes bacterium]|nr:methyltransferase [Planctomycetota bacterium]
MSVPEALRVPELRRFPLRRRDIEASHERLRLVVPKSSQELLKCGWSPSDLPHWADIWPSAVALARYVARGEDRFDGVSVVDLGCGVGTAGLALARRDARVVFADASPEALAFAKFNVALNQCEGEFLAFDWSRDRLPVCDLLVLSDVAYEYRAIRPLQAQITAAVACGGSVWCVDPYRPTTNDLVAWMSREFDTESDELRTSWDGKRHEIRFVRVRAS